METLKHQQSSEETEGSGSGGGGGTAATGGFISPLEAKPMDQYDLTSLEILNKCHLELFPKKETIYDDDNCEFIEKHVPLLAGEYMQYLGRAGKSNEDLIVLTNYRLFLLTNSETSFVNFPIMLLEYVEVKEMSYVYLYLKNCKTVRLYFATSDKCTLWHQRLNAFVNKIGKLDEVFSFTFYLWYMYEKQPDEAAGVNGVANGVSALTLSPPKPPFANLSPSANPRSAMPTIPTQPPFYKYDPKTLMQQEFKRMQFDQCGGAWRLSTVNSGYKMCPTYPELLIVPSSMSDEQLLKVANFRSSRRLPTIVWRNKANGCVIARSSQPNVGLLAWRLNEDELLIKAIANTSGALSTPPNTAPSGSSSSSASTTTMTDEQTSTDDPASPQGILLIIDARCRSVALANRVKGGGYEYSEYYTNCEIQFMNLENIHVIRSSFQTLRLLCQSITENKTFLSQLENSKWLHHLSGIMRAARTVVSSLDRQRKPVLIHCSDGWDRTPQILALAKLLLDPYYRTIRGFQCLVELDWLQFGHKFAQRNGHAVNHADTNERCPVFLQWLDCVYQVVRQYPAAFEFNEHFLLKLCLHSYSCLFGTFLCDSFEERVRENLFERTFSIWSYLGDRARHEFTNYLYDEATYGDQVLYPQYEIANLSLWYNLYCDSDMNYLIRDDEKCLIEEEQQSLSSSAHTPAAFTVPQDDEDDSPHFFGSFDDTGVSNSNGNAEVGGEKQRSQAIAFERRATVPKTRSFDSDLNRLGRSVAVCSTSPALDALLLCSTSPALNGDPVACRTCSGTNLLADALNERSSFMVRSSLNGSLNESHGAANQDDESRDLVSSVKMRQSTETIVNDGAVPVNGTGTEDPGSGSGDAGSEWQSKSVSTSTSGLSDYVYSTKFRHINDSIRKFESQTFNRRINYSSRAKNATYPSKLPSCGTGTDLMASCSSSRLGDLATAPNGHPLNHLDSSLASLPQGVNGANLSRFRNHKLNKNKKTIAECLDVDGLCVAKDTSFKRIVERDEQAKKEIAHLRAQILKCKQFLSSLSSNAFWNDHGTPASPSNSTLTPSNYDLNFDPETRLIEEANAAYSFGSSCDTSLSANSWDEVEEPEYRLTTWVPDHFVTHCQNCNRQFGYAVRKHHCRNCGQVFCYKCSNQYFPLPNQNLITPVRVCLLCKPQVERALSKYLTQQKTNKCCNGTGSVGGSEKGSASDASSINCSSMCNLNAASSSSRYANKMGHQGHQLVSDQCSQKVSV